MKSAVLPLNSTRRDEALGPLIDIGVNLDSPRLTCQIDAVLTRAAHADVRGLILTGTSPEGSARCAEYARTLNTDNVANQDEARCQLWSTAGVHPHDAEAALTRAWRAEIEALLTRPEVVAVGECGLDFERNYSSVEAQREIFEAQLQLAVRHQLPLFLHQRGAHAELLTLLRRYAPELPRRESGALAAVIHCYTGGLEEMQSYLELGCFIGVTGWVCDERRGDALRAAVRSLPLTRVLVETDAPYLTPRTLRPKPKKGTNEPAFLPHIVHELAGYMGVDASELARAATLNTQELFAVNLSQYETNTQARSVDSDPDKLESER